MTDIARLVVNLETNIAQLQTGMEQARAASERASTGIQSAMNRIDRGMQAVIGQARTFATGMIAAFSVERIVSFINTSVEAAGALGDLALQLNLSTTALQVFQYEAAQSGLGVQQLEAGMIRLNDTIGSAANGSATAIASFQNLNVSILDAAGNIRPTQDILTDLARAIMAIEDPARRVAAANDIFGRSGARWLPMLGSLAEGYNTMASRAREAGAVLSTDVTDALKRTTDEWAANQIVLERWGAAVGNVVIGSIRSLVTWLEGLGPRLQTISRGIADFINTITFGTLVGPEIAGHEAEIRRLEGRMRTLQGLISPETEAGFANLPGAVARRREVVTTGIADLQRQIDEHRAAIATLQRRMVPTPEGAPPPTVGVRNPPTGTIAGTAPLIDLTEIAEGRDYFSRIAQRRGGAGGGAGRNVADDMKEQARALDTLLRSLNPVLDATADYQERVEILDRALKTGSITVAQHAEAIGRLDENFKRSTQSAEGLNSSASRTGDTVGTLARLGDGLGNVFAQAADDAAFKWSGFNNLLGNIANSIGRLLLQIALVEPAQQSIRSLFGGKGVVQSFFGSLFGGATGSGTTTGGHEAAHFSAAGGGILSARGPVRLQLGGIARASTLYEIGEGDRDEAVIPLPDNRAVPVRLLGSRSRQGIQVTNHIDARGSETGSAVRLLAAADQIARRQVDALLGRIEAGGKESRITGRRRGR